MLVPSPAPLIHAIRLLVEIRKHPRITQAVRYLDRTIRTWLEPRRENLVEAAVQT